MYIAAVARVRCVIAHTVMLCNISNIIIIYSSVFNVRFLYLVVVYSIVFLVLISFAPIRNAQIQVKKNCYMLRIQCDTRTLNLDIFDEEIFIIY